MAECEGEGEGEGKIGALRRALHQQSLTIEELNAELEEERRAASSGADEALAMILRLQAEKAAERMEALQFRRIAEERIQHDEDSLAFLRGVIFHQEMEMNSLRCQIHAFQHKLSAQEGPVSDVPWLCRSSLFVGTGGGLKGRNISLPEFRLEELCSEPHPIGKEVSPMSVDRGGTGRSPVRSTSDVADWLGRNVHYQLAQRLDRPARTRPARPDRGVEGSISDPRSDAFGAEIERIRCSVRNLEGEIGRMRESSLSRCSEQMQLLMEISKKLDAMQNHMQLQRRQQENFSKRPPSDDELLMNNFIEVCAILFTVCVSVLSRVAASIPFFRSFLLLFFSAVVMGKLYAATRCV